MEIDKEYIFNTIKDDYVITTSFVDRHNDYIQILLIKLEKGFILTDRCYTISNFMLSGLKYKERELNAILDKFNVKLKKDEIFVEVTKDNFLERKDNLIKVILFINNLGNKNK